jgi:hypothetical protein
VLSAGAILSAGNAVVLSPILTGFAIPVPSWVVAGLSLVVMVSTALVILSLFHASNVLVTRQSSRQAFGSGQDLPISPLFNGTDTVEHFPTFADFSNLVRAQTKHDLLAAAEVELWIVVQQHRRRYVELRRAVRDLRYAAVTFLLILVGIILTNLFVSA